MFLVDTNVLVYAADRRAPEHERCRALFESWRRGSGAWYLTWGICYEFLRIATHPRVFRTPWSALEAWQFIAAARESPGLSFLVPGERHAAVVDEIVREVPLLSGNLFHDVESAALMRENGVRRICTRDVDFSRFAFIEVIDPMTAEP